MTGNSQEGHLLIKQAAQHDGQPAQQRFQVDAGASPRAACYLVSGKGLGTASVSS